MAIPHISVTWLSVLSKLYCQDLKHLLLLRLYLSVPWDENEDDTKMERADLKHYYVFEIMCSHKIMKKTGMMFLSSLIILTVKKLRASLLLLIFLLHQRFPLNHALLHQLLLFRSCMLMHGQNQDVK